MNLPDSAFHNITTAWHGEPPAAFTKDMEHAVDQVTANVTQIVDVPDFLFPKADDATMPMLKALQYMSASEFMGNRSTTTLGVFAILAATEANRSAWDTALRDGNTLGEDAEDALRTWVENNYMHFVVRALTALQREALRSVTSVEARSGWVGKQWVAQIQHPTVDNVLVWSISVAPPSVILPSDGVMQVDKARQQQVTAAQGLSTSAPLLRRILQSWMVASEDRRWVLQRLAEVAQCAVRTVVRKAINGDKALVPLRLGNAMAQVWQASWFHMSKPQRVAWIQWAQHPWSTPYAKVALSAEVVQHATDTVVVDDDMHMADALDAAMDIWHHVGSVVPLGRDAETQDVAFESAEDWKVWVQTYAQASLDTLCLAFEDVVDGEGVRHRFMPALCPKEAGAVTTSARTLLKDLLTRTISLVDSSSAATDNTPEAALTRLLPQLPSTTLVLVAARQLLRHGDMQLLEPSKVWLPVERQEAWIQQRDARVEALATREQTTPWAVGAPWLAAVPQSDELLVALFASPTSVPVMDALQQRVLGAPFAWMADNTTLLDEADASQVLAVLQLVRQLAAVSFTARMQQPNHKEWLEARREWSVYGTPLLLLPWLRNIAAAILNSDDDEKAALTQAWMHQLIREFEGGVVDLRKWVPTTEGEWGVAGTNNHHVESFRTSLMEHALMTPEAPLKPLHVVPMATGMSLMCVVDGGPDVLRLPFHILARRWVIESRGVNTEEVPPLTPASLMPWTLSDSHAVEHVAQSYLAHMVQNDAIQNPLTTLLCAIVADVSPPTLTFIAKGKTPTLLRRRRAEDTAGKMKWVSMLLLVTQLAATSDTASPSEVSRNLLARIPSERSAEEWYTRLHEAVVPTTDITRIVPEILLRVLQGNMSPDAYNKEVVKARQAYATSMQQWGMFNATSIQQANILACTHDCLAQVPLVALVMAARLAEFHSNTSEVGKVCAGLTDGNKAVRKATKKRLRQSGRIGWVLKCVGWDDEGMRDDDASARFTFQSKLIDSIKSDNGDACVLVLREGACKDSVWV